MGFLDNFGEKMGNYMEGEMRNAEDRVRREVRMKARKASTEVLKHNLEMFEEKGNYVAVEEIENELSRRGEF